MKTLPELMRLFEFTAEELAANRAGRWSNSQRARIETDRLNASIDKASALAAMACFLTLTLLFLALAYPIGERLGPWTLVFIAVWFTLTVMVANLARRWCVRWLRKTSTNRDHGLLRRFGRLDHQGDVATRTGVITRIVGVLTHGDDGEHANLLLDGKPFQPDSSSGDTDERLWTLAPGVRYAFYAVPEVLWVMSVEPLEGD